MEAVSHICITILIIIMHVLVGKFVRYEMLKETVIVTACELKTHLLHNRYL